MGSQSNPKVTSSVSLSYWTLILALLIAFSAGAAFGYILGAPTTSSCAPDIRSGSQISTSAPSKADLAPYVSRCHDICTATASVGINVSDGICLNNDLNGYACAVVVHDSGHCPSYFKGAPEIVFDTKCSYVGLYRAKDGAK